MKLYRAMSDEEWKATSSCGRLSWNSKFKWFGTYDFVTSRVMDGNFNNSKFVSDRYKNLVEFDIADESMIHFVLCGNNEYMLNVRKAPLVKINSFRKLYNDS